MADTKKPLKSGELGGGWFFSSLGFDSKKAAKKEATKQEIKKPTDEIKKEDLLNASLTSQSFANAKVIRSASPSSRPPSRRSSRPPSRRSSRPPRRGDAPRRSDAPRGNISFGKGKRKPYRKTATPAPTPAATPARKTEKKAAVSTNLVKKTEITIGGMITIKELSEKMGAPLPELMKIMLQNKILGGLNTAIDYDTACLIAEELGVKVTKEQDTVSVDSLLEWDLKTILDIDKEAGNLQSRPPIVTIMGHVDHGKTTLLDYLRKTNVAGGEAGGITQSIGASTITHNNKQITFIDTPGHELFTTMRARGSKITDIVVIIVAADDGFMPQTIESINHAKEAGVPIIVAITKIDKPWANKQEDIKADLGKHELIPEERGGDIPVIGVSGITGQGIDELLEHISLQAEMLELTYNPDRQAVGVVVDAQKTAKQGIETALIIMTGTLKVGDIIAVHDTYGKVKRMIDRKGKTIRKASGGDPIMILGINNTPQPGRIAEGVKNEKEAAQKIAIIKEKEDAQKASSGLKALISQIESGEKTIVRLILKADGPTALEALEHAIDTIECPDNVSIKKIHTDIGQFTDSDLTLAEASQALLIGFNVKTNASIIKKAEQMKLTIKTYNIIYELTEYLEDLVMGLIEVEMTETVIGSLNVLAIFFAKGKEMVIGGKVSKGLIKNGIQFNIRRADEIIGKGTINSLQREKNTVKEVSEGYECGMKVKVSKKIQAEDTLEFREMQEVTDK